MKIMILTACIFLKHLIKLKKQIKKILTHNFSKLLICLIKIPSSRQHLKKMLKVLIPMITKKTYYVHTL